MKESSYWTIKNFHNQSKCRDSVCWLLRHNWDLYITLCPPNQSLSKKRWKDRKSQRLGSTRGKECLLDMTEPPHRWSQNTCGCLHKTCTTSIHHVNIPTGKCGRHSSAPPPPPAVETLWTVDGFCQRKSMFAIRMWPQVGWPCSRRWPQTYEYIGSTNWTEWIMKNKGK